MSSTFSSDAARKIDGPSWLVNRRVAAAETLRERAVPTVAEEEWRYSPIAELDLDAFAPSDAFGDAPMARLDIEPAATVRCINGKVVSIEVSDALADKGVFVGLLTGHADGESALGSVSDDAGDYFTQLNDAFTPHPVLVDIPRGVTVDCPIVITHHAAGDHAATFSRLVVRVGKNAEATVLDQYSSDDGDVVLACPVVELDVDQSGRLGYLSIQELGDSTWQIASQVARVERDATVSAGTAAFGGAYARSRADTRLVGRGAHGDLQALYFGDESQTLDFRTYQDHVAPDTTSNLLYKGVVAGKARSIYTGLIRVRPGARGTNACQTNRILKLSDDAWAESVPNLEIENNDVKCSHASTVSPVDGDQRFYLESRGVPTGDAERLIVAGFLDEVITELAVPSAAQGLRRSVATKLARQHEQEVSE